MYLNSYAACKVAALEAVKSTRTRTHKTPDQIASEMDIWRPCDELVRVNLLRKPNTECDYRFPLSFGVVNQARQILVRTLLQARWAVSPGQMMFAGGRNAAVNKLNEHYENGYRHVMEVDIYKCFHGFDEEKIGNFLSLPQTVVSHNLCGLSLNISPSLYVIED